MALSNIVKNFVDGALTGADDGGNSATLRLPTGNLSLTGLRAAGRNVADYQSRGSLASTRRTDRAFPQISVSRLFTEAWDPDGLKELSLGMTAGFVSTMAAKGDAAAIDLTFVVSYDAETHTIVCEDCVASVDITEGDPSEESLTWDVKGRVSLDGNWLIAAA